ncbi:MULTISPECIES: phage tail assembly protein [unclassified Rhizobium]|uniref:phage tail assembly protein n=1 Tax=unclassified Rhizobium TaxID=2613769 RepID=UPI001ADAC6ED|nr:MULTISPECIES: phage tail assembly protein [unclassified Rhizobium]MBO9125448.1 phage tail assembly protein [Rhizobium sp. 16-488-2b]MBO9176033.1 phage tail assembly protein [Rhizobium sp. 16-488-2a]
MDNISVTLLSPVTVDEVTIDSLTFREAEVGDLIEAADCKNEIERMAVMMASVTGVSLPVIKKLKARDLKNIMSKVGNLLGNDTKTGSTGTA